MADEAEFFLEHCMMPAMLTGGLIDLKGTQYPIAGITGFGRRNSISEKRSTWVTGEILSPVFIGNEGCVSKSHIEGIATDGYRLHVLEQVHAFPACEGDCIEYLLDLTTKRTETPLIFEGKAIARRNRNNFEPVEVGRVTLTLNPYWLIRNDGGTSCSHSVPYWNRLTQTNGVYIPHFWNEFIESIRSQGHAVPYE